MVPNSTASRAELQALFPLLSVGCDAFIDMDSQSHGKLRLSPTHRARELSMTAIQRRPRFETGVR
jgi:hypothetical protein